MDQEVGDNVEKEEFDHQRTFNIDFVEQTVVFRRGEKQNSVAAAELQPPESLPALPQAIRCFPNGREWTYKLDCF